MKNGLIESIPNRRLAKARRAEIYLRSPSAAQSFGVGLGGAPLEIGGEFAPPRNHRNQPAAGVLVLFVRCQVGGQMLNSPGQAGIAKRPTSLSCKRRAEAASDGSIAETAGEEEGALLITDKLRICEFCFLIAEKKNYSTKPPPIAIMAKYFILTRLNFSPPQCPQRPRPFFPSPRRRQ